MNTLITFVTIVILFSSKIRSVPIDTTGYADFTSESVSFESTLTTTTTTTTTTQAPELDRDWEDLILAGPTVVKYLSLFMVLASDKDLNMTIPAGYTVKYLGNSQFLRAALSKISEDMQAAFKIASDDLVRTRDSMNDIPEHLKAGLVLIQTAPADLLSKLLPYTLRNVDRAANEGAAVTKPTLERFTSVGLALHELTILLNSTSLATDAAYLSEANAYANDIKTQWNLLVKLFTKFSNRADFTLRSISENFIGPINQVEKTNGSNSQSPQSGQLDKLIPAAIAIDQSSNLLEMMARTYSDISKQHMVDQITASKSYLGLQNATTRAANQRQLWQNTIAESVKVARLTQGRQDKFAGSGPARQTAYATYLQNATAA